MQSSKCDSSTLKKAVLEMWVPAVGVQKANELYSKNYEKLHEYFLRIMGIPCELIRLVDLALNSLNTSWDEFCSLYIFKTNFENYFDTQPPFQLGEAILSGSMNEGLFLHTLQPPDMDIMCVLNNISFTQEDQENGSLLLRDDTPFVNTFIQSKATQNLWKDFLEEPDEKTEIRRLSSRKLKGKLEKNYLKTDGIFCTSGKEELDEVAEGAAVTIRKPKCVLPSSSEYAKAGLEFIRQLIVRKISDVDRVLATHLTNTLFDKLINSSDIVLSIFCEGWPRCATEWITRERFWPDKPTVEKITQAGFHIVPKSSPDGDFRLSFSRAETMLIASLSPLQHRVMRAFKAIVKYHENTLNSSLRKIVSSYHLKTIAFWHFEKTSKESWTEETVVHHLVRLLEELAEALLQRTLPMYFMPKVNLFHDINDPQVMIELMGKISELSCNFVGMTEAVSNKTIFKGTAIITYINPGSLNPVDVFLQNTFETPDEPLLTWYDVFEAAQNLVSE